MNEIYQIRVCYFKLFRNYTQSMVKWGTNLESDLILLHKTLKMNLITAMITSRSPVTHYPGLSFEKFIYINFFFFFFFKSLLIVNFFFKQL